MMGLTASEASIVSLERLDTRIPTKIVARQPEDDAAAIQESLRRDVAEHPNDFVVFETEAGANRFMTEHRDYVQRETSRKITSRGVLGYWKGKTLVVLRWAALKTSSFTTTSLEK
jgi:hypothetical protein